MQTYFDREDTKVIKGIAILLMLAHHLWAFPDRIYGGGFTAILSVFGMPLSVFIGKFGKICVSLYFFLSGYGLYKSSRGKKLDILLRLKGLYSSYWKVFFLFIPIAFLFFSNQPEYCEEASLCFRYAALSNREFISNVLGITCTYNSEWWFFRAYVVALLTFPFLNRIMDNRPVVYNIAGIIVFSILETNVFPAIGQLEVLGSPMNNVLYSSLFCQSSPFITCFWMGILMAREDLLGKVREGLINNHLLNPITDIIVLACIPYLENCVFGSYLDFLFVPAVILFSLDLLERCNWVRKILHALGAQSTNMWLIHSFFCYYFYFFVRITVYSNNALISLITLVAMTYAASIMTDKIWKTVFGMGRKIGVIH